MASDGAHSRDNALPQAGRRPWWDPRAWGSGSSEGAAAGEPSREVLLVGLVAALSPLFFLMAVSSALTRAQPLGASEMGAVVATFACTLVALLLARRGRTRAGALLLSVGAIVVAFWVALTEHDGSRALDSIVFVLTGVVYAGHLLPVRTAARAAVAAVCATLLLVVFHPAVTVTAAVLPGFSVAILSALLVTAAHQRARQQAVVDERTRALRVSEARLRATFDASPDAIVAVDAGGKVLSWSRQAALLLGWSEAEVAGRAFLPLVSAGRLSEPLARRLAELGGREVSHCACSVRDRAGRLFPVEVSMAPMDLDGRPCLSLFLRDVAESQRLKAELIERDRMVTVGRLAAGVAHEINNPLSAVFTNTEVARDVLARSGDAEGLDPLLADVLDGARRVRDIVTDLRSFAKEPTEPEGPVDVRDALDSALQLGAGDWRRCTVLESEHGPLPLVAAAKGQLVRVFVSLVANAAQSRRSGGPVPVRITSRVRGAFVEVRVEDGGDGIPAEHLERIFAPFFTTREVGEGSGLGLYVARNTLRALGGDLVLERSGPEGSVFLVTLRAVSGIGPAVGPEPRRSPASSAPLRILVVDDDRSVAEALRRCLSGHVVTVAERAERALDEVRAQPFDLVLADVRMPGMSGAELAERLVDELRYEADRVVLMTGGTLHDREAAAVRRWGRRCLDKPVRLDDLLAVVAAVAPRALAVSPSA